MFAVKRTLIPAALLVALGSGASSLAVATDAAPQVSASALKPPKEIKSRNGVLKAKLVADEGPAIIAGKRITNATTYNGQYPGPTLRVKPGDTIDLTVANKLSAGTNIHFHGFHVSPSADSDNVLRHFAPGTTKRVVVHIPRDHANGTYWYHPHLHGQVNNEVYGGMAGLIVVEGGEGRLRSIERYPERQLAFQAADIKPDSDQLVSADNMDNNHALTTINGQFMPTIAMRPGRTEHWRLANISNELWYELQLEDHNFRVVGEDGNFYDSTVKKSRLLLPPGKRFDVLVKAEKTGSIKLRRLKYSTGFDTINPRDVATVNVSGNKTESPPVPKHLKDFQDLSKAKVDVHRKLVFKIQTVPTLAFLINNKEFNANEVNVHARLNQIEEWEIKNPSSEDHPFHIHTNDYQVVKINGKRQKVHGVQDTTKIPHGGSITIRMKPITFTGKAVYHCHILFHEDHGMMGVVEWTKDKSARYTIARAASNADHGKAAHATAAEAQFKPASLVGNLGGDRSGLSVTDQSPGPPPFFCQLPKVASAPERRGTFNGSS